MPTLGYSVLVVYAHCKSRCSLAVHRPHTTHSHLPPGQSPLNKVGFRDGLNCTTIYLKPPVHCRQGLSSTCLVTVLLSRVQSNHCTPAVKLLRIKSHIAPASQHQPFESRYAITNDHYYYSTRPVSKNHPGAGLWMLHVAKSTYPRYLIIYIHKVKPASRPTVFRGQSLQSVCDMQIIPWP